MFGARIPVVSFVVATLVVVGPASARTPAGVGIAAHNPVFAEDPLARETTDLISQVSAQIGSHVSNIPLGTSAGGFTYEYDSGVGTFMRSTDTFGPAFAERAVTAGRGRFSLGLNYLHSSFKSLDGQDLKNGDISFNLQHQRLAPASYVEGDVIQAALQMDLKSDTTTFLFNYGVTNRFDIGVAVPVVRVEMDLTYNATILDFATATVSPTTHLFANGQKRQSFSASGSAMGVGDVVARARVALTRNRRGSGVAVGVDVRLPTGDEDDMLGAGATQTRVFLIASGGGRVSPHVNVGYSAATGNVNVADVFSYIGGFEFGVSPRVTLNLDFIGRSSRDALKLSRISVPHQFQPGPTAAIQRTTLTGFSVAPGTLNTGIGTFGAKINVAGNLILSVHAIAPFTDDGLRSRPSAVAGFDYTF